MDSPQTPIREGRDAVSGSLNMDMGIEMDRIHKLIEESLHLGGSVTVEELEQLYIEYADLEAQHAARVKAGIAHEYFGSSSTAPSGWESVGDDVGEVINSPPRDCSNSGSNADGSPAEATAGRDSNVYSTPERRHKRERVQLCKLYQRVECTYGSKCRFSHEKVGASDDVCRAYRSGKCTRGNSCKFRHEGQVKAVDICHNFSKGFCGYGDKCNYSHSTPESPQTPIRPDPDAEEGRDATGETEDADDAAATADDTPMEIRISEGICYEHKYRTCELGDACPRYHNPRYNPEEKAKREAKLKAKAGIQDKLKQRRRVINFIDTVEHDECSVCRVAQKDHSLLSPLPCCATVVCRRCMATYRDRSGGWHAYKNWESRENVCPFCCCSRAISDEDVVNYLKAHIEGLDVRHVTRSVDLEVQQQKMQEDEEEEEKLRLDSLNTKGDERDDVEELESNDFLKNPNITYKSSGWEEVDLSQFNATPRIPVPTTKWWAFEALGTLHADGSNSEIEQSWEVASQYYEQASLCTDIPSITPEVKFDKMRNHMFEIGSLYLHGRSGRETSNAKAFHFYSLAAGRYCPKGHYSLAWMWETGGVPDSGADMTKALAHYKAAAKRGSADAKLTLAYFYRYGIHVSQKFQTAFSLYSDAAASGIVVANIDCGEMMEAGEGVEGKLFAEAEFAYKIAAAANHARAHFRLASMYSVGRGTTIATSPRKAHYHLMEFFKEVSVSEEGTTATMIETAKVMRADLVHQLRGVCGGCGSNYSIASPPKKEDSNDDASSSSVDEGKEALFGLFTFRCGGCRSVYYCDKECQALHWRCGHNEECRK